MNIKTIIDDNIELQFVIHQIKHLPRKIGEGKIVDELYYDFNKKLTRAEQINIITCSFRT
jgi:hypothetical protein